MADLIALSMYSGARLGELVNLKVEDVEVGSHFRIVASKALRVGQATLGGLLLAARFPPDAMTRLSMARTPGSSLAPTMNCPKLGGASVSGDWTCDRLPA